MISRVLAGSVRRMGMADCEVDERSRVHGGSVDAEAILEF